MMYSPFKVTSMQHVCVILSAAYTRVLFSKGEANRAAAAFGNKAVSVAKVLKGLRTMVAVVRTLKS